MKAQSVYLMDAHERINFVPNAEYEVRQPPSIKAIDKYSNLLEDHGISVAQIMKTAQVFDSVRTARRHCSQMIDHNSDRQLYN